MDMKKLWDELKPTISKLMKQVSIIVLEQALVELKKPKKTASITHLGTIPNVHGGQSCSSSTNNASTCAQGPFGADK